MRNRRLASWGLLIPMLLNANTVSAQLMQGIPRSPIETMGGSADRMPAGWYVMPWVATGVVYDDNVFFAPRAQRTGRRVPPRDPGLQGSYQSTPLTVIANYRFDSEVYSKLTNLDAGPAATIWHCGITRTPFEQFESQWHCRLCANAHSV